MFVKAKNNGPIPLIINSDNMNGHLKQKTSIQLHTSSINIDSVYIHKTLPGKRQVKSIK